MQDDWKLGHAGRIGYLDAIAELGDYRKVNGASESVSRGLSLTEMYLKKVCKTVIQDDAVAVDQRTRHRRLRSQGTLGTRLKSFWKWWGVTCRATRAC